MGKTDRGEHPLMFDDYVVQQVDAQWLQERVKPKRHIGLTPELCILCRACEDVCPWECIYMMSPDIIKGADSPNLMSLAAQSARRVHHRRQRVHALRDLRGAVPDRCPVGSAGSTG